jgi:transposase
MKRPNKNKPKTNIPRSVAHRLRSVQLALTGISAVKVAAKYGDSQTAVSSWIRRFKAKGLQGLEVLPRSGQPAKLSPAQFGRLGKFVTKADERGEKLSASTVSAFVKKSFGVNFTRQHSWRLVKRFRS